MEKTSAWLKYDEKELKNLEDLSLGYRQFLDRGKTERECVKEIITAAERKGYENLETIIADKRKIKTGDKIYAVCMNKAVAMFNIGKNPLNEGMNILGAHIDSPRLDIKQNPLYEDTDLAFLDTHYYGGIKKYQWVALPLSIHGVVCKKDGRTVEINIGEKESDPVFCITDLLPHLAQDQVKKPAATFIAGDDLNLLIGNMPLKGKDKDAVVANILKLLEENCGISEEDFISAELEVVPAGTARECGLDRSLIMAYGQDDRVCAYTSLTAMLNVDKVTRTSCCLLVDKEEIGSVGATGMQSRFFENTVAEIFNCMGEYSELMVRRCLASSAMLSSDVSAGYDPGFASVFEKKNAAILTRGMVFNKFTGSRGKSGSNDANAEYLGKLRDILDKAGVSYQTAEMGKVDVGGGGTIAYILALYGMDVIDSGVGVLSMHAPWEVTSKADIFEAEKGYEAFLKGMK